MKRASLALVLVGIFLAGCGNTIGGPCTTSSDCPNQVCIPTASYAPGGYCSKQCVVGTDSTCPSNATCVTDGIAHGIPGCFLKCTTNKDCRSGYTCQTGFHGNPNSICVGPGT